MAPLQTIMVLDVRISQNGNSYNSLDIMIMSNAKIIHCIVSIVQSSTKGSMSGFSILFLTWLSCLTEMETVSGKYYKTVFISSVVVYCHMYLICALDAGCWHVLCLFT